MHLMIGVERVIISLMMMMMLMMMLMMIPIVVTLVGIVIDVKDEHLSKACVPNDRIRC